MYAFGFPPPGGTISGRPHLSRSGYQLGKIDGGRHGVSGWGWLGRDRVADTVGELFGCREAPDATDAAYGGGGVVGSGVEALGFCAFWLRTAQRLVVPVGDGRQCPGYAVEVAGVIERPVPSCAAPQSRQLRQQCRDFSSERSPLILEGLAT